MPPSAARPQSAQVSSPWKRNEFHTFYANMNIRVGGHNGNDPIEISKGDEFDYDGSVCKYGGREFPQPNLRGAVRDGWASLSQDGSTPSPFTSSRDVAVSQSKNTDLNRVQRRPRAPLESDSLDEETVLEVGDRRAVRDARSGRGHLTASNNRRTDAGFVEQPDVHSRMEVTASDVDEQDAVEISPIRTKARSTPVDVLKNPTAARDVENSLDHAKGFGRFEGPRRAPNVIQREGVIITSSVGDMDRSRGVEVAEEGDGRRVGTVRHSSASKRSVEGVSVEDTSGDRSRPKAPARAAAKAPPAKAAPKPAAPRIPDDASPKLKMAIRRCPEFPVDWNFFAKPDDKLARIKKLGASPDLLDAVYTAESPAMKKVLEQKFKSHFA